MMYNPQLETFMCVVESGSFSKAAEKLYISSPAVIKQINSLEASLGVQLFSRTHRGLVVTEAGKSIYNVSNICGRYSLLIPIPVSATTTLYIAVSGVVPGISLTEISILPCTQPLILLLSSDCKTVHV